MKKIIKKIICIICILTVFATMVSIPASAAGKVVYEFPFNDYSKWYTGVDGSTDGFAYGYLEGSPTKFLDYTYENGAAKMFLTDSIMKLKAYQYGSSGGWPTLYYTYDKPVEIDLTSVAFEYEIAAQTFWRLSLVLERADENGNFTVYLDQFDTVADLAKIPSTPVEEPVVTKNKLNILQALKKNYFANLSDIGLDKGNTIKLKGIEIMFRVEQPATLWPVNEFRCMRFVKDANIPAGVKPEQTESETEEPTDETLSVYVPTDDDKVTSSDESSEVSSDTASNPSDQDSAGVNVILLIIIGAIVIACIAAGTVVIIMKRKK